MLHEFHDRELEELQGLAGAMRRLGIVHYKRGDREILLGPEPPAPAREDETPEQRAGRAREEQLRILLHSSGADISPFLEKP
jgi:hypothetical protein